MTCTTHTHSLCRRTRTALARCNASDAVVAEEAGRAVREGRPAGWGGGPGRVAGWAGWRAGQEGGPGRMVGRVGWRAEWGGGPGGEAGRVVGGGRNFGKNVLK